jgi:meso-butanediol dehydrogenase / (S,S)-butanediol dehydrogenase / diacetyl reductase
MRLDGRVALITGTGGGQGRAAAVRFAFEGAIIVGCDLKAAGAAETQRLVEAAGGQMMSFHPLDLGDSEQVAAWIAAAVDEFGGFDILYNNAGTPRLGEFAGLTWADWSATIRNELDLVYLTCHHAWPHMVARGGGSIINTASMICDVVIGPGGAAHAAAKSGVLGLTKALAVEGGPHGIRANAISPGFIVSPATEGALDRLPELGEGWRRQQLVGRLGTPEDVANCALFLASDESAFITGTRIVVDGGYSAVKAPISN